MPFYVLVSGSAKNELSCYQCASGSLSECRREEYLRPCPNDHAVDTCQSVISKRCEYISMYRAEQNHGKQVVRISPIKFHFPIIQFVVIPHGQRDLSSLPWTGEAAVQIS